MNKIYKSIKKMQDKANAVDKKAVLISVAVSLIFVVIWILFGYHLNDYTNSYRKSMNELIMSQTENESETISSGFNTRCDMVRYLSASLSNMSEGDYDNGIASALKNVMTADAFINVVYIDKKGTVIFPDGTKSKEYDTESVVSLLDISDRYAVFSNKQKFITNTPSFGIIAPVRRKGEIRGYVCGIAGFSELVEDAYIRREIAHDEIILDSSGRVVVKILENNEIEFIEDTIDFFERVDSAMTADAYGRFLAEYNECVASMSAGKSIVRTGDENIMYVYYPIQGTNGWTVMNCYPDNILETRMRGMQIKSIIIFAVIVALMIVAAVILLKYLSGEKKRISALEYLDGLTGVYNRSAFISHAENVLRDNKTMPYTIICFDIINFRIINETYGHERSDEIIKAIAEACKEAFGHNEAYGRLTADVYVALVLDDGEEAERIRFIEEQVKERAERVYINHPIRIKRGRCAVDSSAETVNRMIDKANIARKYVNTNSNELLCQYSEELMTEARKAEEIESKMEGALFGGEFKPYLQPKYNMVENRCIGAEALVRWVRPDGTVVPPGDFIPLFEKNGFVEKVDFYMLEQICKYLRQMLDEGREVYTISVNQSRYLMNDPQYVNKVKKILLKYQIPIGLIELELTETVFFHEKERMINMMKELKKMNVNLSIDDFGSGYSSFNILKDVPFDVLKIDREFLTDSVHTKKGRWILQEIVEMAHGLGMSVICEGVETEEHIELLVSIHCHKAQGFYYSRPIPLEDFIEKYNYVKG